VMHRLHGLSVSPFSDRSRRADTTGRKARTMDDTVLRSTHSERLIPCPDCGESFVPRGIAAHRRMKHGLRDAPLPSTGRRALSAQEVAVLITRELAPFYDRLNLAIVRIEARLAGIENRLLPAAVLDGAASELEAHLSSVISEIDRVKAEWAQLASNREGVTPTEEHRELEKTTYITLGELRRQQAKLLFDLQDLKGERERIDCIK